MDKRLREWTRVNGQQEVDMLVVLRFLKVNTRENTCMPDKDVSHLPRQTIPSARHPERRLDKIVQSAPDERSCPKGQRKHMHETKMSRIRQADNSVCEMSRGKAGQDCPVCTRRTKSSKRAGGNTGRLCTPTRWVSGQITGGRTDKGRRNRQRTKDENLIGKERDDVLDDGRQAEEGWT
jgi:hypothetical protein